VKNCLAVLGFFSVLLILGLGLLLVAIYVEQPESFPANISTIQAVEPPGNGGLVIERQNPLEGYPLPTMPAEASPLPSPTPPPDPVAYRTTVLLRARSFGILLNEFIVLNQELQENPGLLSDPNWQTEVRTTLDLFVASAWALSDTGTVPPEYHSIHQWLVQVGPEAQAMRDHYVQGIQQGDQVSLQTAGENLARINDLMTQAEIAMVEAGWEG